jgi:hypothetical protein
MFFCWGALLDLHDARLYACTTSTLASILTASYPRSDASRLVPGSNGVCTCWLHCKACSANDACSTGWLTVLMLWLVCRQLQHKKKAFAAIFDFQHDLLVIDQNQAAWNAGAVFRHSTRCPAADNGGRRRQQAQLAAINIMRHIHTKQLAGSDPKHTTASICWSSPAARHGFWQHPLIFHGVAR